jgi:hypothetical protein
MHGCFGVKMYKDRGQPLVIGPLWVSLRLQLPQLMRALCFIQCSMHLVRWLVTVNTPQIHCCQQY